MEGNNRGELKLRAVEAITTGRYDIEEPFFW